MKAFQWALGAAVALGLGTSASFAADTTLRISLQLPLTSHLGQNLVLFKDEVSPLLTVSFADHLKWFCN